VLVSVRPAAQCRCVPVNADVSVRDMPQNLTGFLLVTAFFVLLTGVVVGVLSIDREKSTSRGAKAGVVVALLPGLLSMCTAQDLISGNEAAEGFFWFMLPGGLAGFFAGMAGGLIGSAWRRRWNAHR
jgi:hypothetical protein